MKREEYQHLVPNFVYLSVSAPAKYGRGRRWRHTGPHREVVLT
jgi:hypothetical protein